jgi:hypothetical protein
MATAGRTTILVVAVALLAGCATMARVTNAESPICASSLRQSLSDVLENRGESTNDSVSLADQAVDSGLLTRIGPRAFVLEAPGGTDYVFFVQRKHDVCLLHLYGEHKGFVTYTNDLWYIATRELSGCECSDESSRRGARRTP